MVRLLAYDILIRYFKMGSYLNLSLNHCLMHHSLSSMDKDLLTHMIYGVVQYKLALEYQMELLIKDKKIDIEVYVILMMALYQWCYLDKIPEYAIISSSVDLAKKKLGRYKASFVNALLRQYQRSGQRSLEELPIESKLSIETSHPQWLVLMLQHQYGLEKTERILRANNIPPLLSARYNVLRGDKSQLYKQGFKDGFLTKSALIYEGGNIAQTEAYQQGWVSIQDESSQCVAWMLAPQKQQRVLDMCSAPGSKACHIAEMMGDTGEIIAVDIHEHKIPLIEKQAKRLHLKSIHPLCHDATTLHEIFDPSSFDAILLDAPCSGLGVVNRKPEIKYHPSTDMDELIPLQAKLLEEAYFLLKKGGNLVYSTCTINKKENAYQVQKFLQLHTDMQLLNERQILPYEYHSDGFYMAKMQKGDS